MEVCRISGAWGARRVGEKGRSTFPCSIAQPHAKALKHLEICRFGGALIGEVGFLRHVAVHKDKVTDASAHHKEMKNLV